MRDSRIAMASLGAALLVGGIALEGQELPGSYRLTICSGMCDPGDTSGVVAEGYVVLFDSSDFLRTLPASSREELTHRSWLYLRRSGSATACFSIPWRQRAVDGRELYAGIHPRAATQWSETDGRIQIRIYQSPDAHYTLDGRLEGSRIVGEGRQEICCGYGPPPKTGFVAERIGPPDAQDCLAR